MYAILFDIDGTLLQSGGAGCAAFVETFRAVFQLNEFPEGICFAGRSDRAIAQEIMQRSKIEPSPANWQRFFEDYCGRLEKSLKVCEGTVLPGVVELLDALEEDSHTAVGLLTGNTHFGAQAKTGVYGLAGRFAFGGYGDQRTDRNAIAVDARLAAEEYVAAASSNGLLCGAMVIGDTPADVRCGRAIDAFVVAVATGGSSREELADCQPDLLLEDLTDTGDLLAEVSAAQRRCSQLVSQS
ncbi:MAG: HAD hydrolase-like protein [Planctomycetes bacterium]|nr:HAD hydrolase-like protein [Planctomycetota bacterium]